MRHGSLFLGIGGFELAAEWMDWINVFHCEWNEFGQRVLKHHFPKSKSYGDITQTDFTIHRGDIDIPVQERIHEKVVEFDTDAIAKLQERVPMWREYLNSEVRGLKAQSLNFSTKLNK